VIQWLLRGLGVRDECPDVLAVRSRDTESEARYEHARQEAERAIARADQETESNRESWERLFDDPRGRQ